MSFIETVPIHRTDCNLKPINVEVNKELRIGKTIVEKAVDAKEEVEKALNECKKLGIIGTVQEVRVTLKEKEKDGKTKTDKTRQSESPENT